MFNSSHHCLIKIEELNNLRQNNIILKNKLDLTENLLKDNESTQILFKDEIKTLNEQLINQVNENQSFNKSSKFYHTLKEGSMYQSFN